MIEIYVYGAETRCASCANLPSSQETATWLESALARKYKEERIHVHYVDIHQPQNVKEKTFANRVIREDIWYPVVVIEDEIVSEGVAQLKKITAKLESLGVKKAK